MADFILNMPLRFFARVFGNPAGDPVLLKSRGVTLLRDNNIDIYGADIEVNCVSTTTGTLVSSSWYSKFTLESLVLHNISISTGYLLHFSNLHLGCVFHKIKRGTTVFLFSLNEHETLKIHQIDNAMFSSNSKK